MITVLEAGLETSVQDYPGRVGLGDLGFPASGPFDSWSFRLANLVVGNDPGAAGLECQFMGPTLRFEENMTLAVCGADMSPKLDGVTLPMWESVAVKKGQVLAMSFAKKGARAYIAVSGGLDTAPVLGSRATFHESGVGGVGGFAIKKGQTLPVTVIPGTPGLRVREENRPIFSATKVWDIEAVPGPNDDWLDDACRQRFYSADWKLTAKSSRSGFRLDGPEWTFSDLALNKHPDHGSDPSNIVDHGYPLGAVNLAGQTPIILVTDGPSFGGFINPYTVPTVAFWKLAQMKAGETIHFRKVSVDEAQALRREMEARIGRHSIEPVG